MSYLFVIQNNRVFPHPEILLMHPFKAIWERDTTEKKTFALEEFTYMEFLTSTRLSNPYKGYELKDRIAVLKKEVITRANWKPDALINEGIAKLDKFQHEGSEYYRFFQSARTGLEKLQAFFDTFDMTDTNEKTGSPLYKPKDITNALNDMTKVLQSYKELDKKVQEDLYDTKKTRADKRVSVLANPDTAL